MATTMTVVTGGGADVRRFLAAVRTSASAPTVSPLSNS